MSENISPASQLTEKYQSTWSKPASIFYFLFCKVLLSHSMLSSKPSPFVALAWEIIFYSWKALHYQINAFLEISPKYVKENHLENLECPIFKFVEAQGAMYFRHAHRTLNVLSSKLFTRWKKSSQGSPACWQERQAPHLSVLLLPTLRLTLSYWSPRGPCGMDKYKFVGKKNSGWFRHL